MLGTLTLDQLRILVAIVERGSFSAAGRALNRAQSAISQAVATLEDRHGVLLFDRAGHRPVLTEAGRALAAEARATLAAAARFEALAAATSGGLEPELALAIDPLVPTAAFLDSLRALQAAYPHLPVTFSTEGLGGAERRLRRGDAALAFCLLLPTVPDDVAAIPLLGLSLIPVAAAAHPLARAADADGIRPATRADLEQHVQLVLSDPTLPAGSPGNGILSSRTWRFVDLGRRLDFLLAGMGWCRMPEPLVAPLLADGRLVRLVIEDDLPPPAGALTIHAAHLRARPLGRAGSWLLADLRSRFV